MLYFHLLPSYSITQAQQQKRKAMKHENYVQKSKAMAKIDNNWAWLRAHTILSNTFGLQILNGLNEIAFGTIP